MKSLTLELPNTRASLIHPQNSTQVAHSPRLQEQPYLQLEFFNPPRPSQSDRAAQSGEETSKSRLENVPCLFTFKQASMKVSISTTINLLQPRNTSLLLQYSPATSLKFHSCPASQLSFHTLNGKTLLKIKSGQVVTGKISSFPCRFE